MKIFKVAWDEIHSHASLILTICIFTGIFFWTTPIMIYQLLNPETTFHLEIGDLFYMILIGLAVGLRLVIIVENTSK